MTPLLATCRFCVSEIPSAATVCRACGRDQLETMTPSRVALAGIDLPFTDIMWLLVKWTAASLPALLIIVISVAGVMTALKILADLAHLSVS